MKHFFLVAALALAAISGLVAGTRAASAQSWMDIARQPVPSYQPFRGYNGAQTYIGQTYSPGAAQPSNPADALLSDPNDGGVEVNGISLHEHEDEDCF